MTNGGVDVEAPTLDLQVDGVHVEPGMDITIKGKVTDSDGISKIRMVCHDLYLDKTIDIISIYNGPLKEYDLDYTLQTARHFEGENFVVTVTVTDVTGRTVSKDFGANLDADFTAPNFATKPGEEITVLIKKETAIKLNVDVTDNRVVDYIEVDLKKVDGGTETSINGFPKRIDGGEKRLAWSEAVSVPAEAATYKAYIKAADRAVQEEAHVITSESVINVMELPNFDAIYLADVNSAEQLNSDLFGVPIAMDHVGDYKYRVKYYNEKAGTEICFLGQKTDFGPICFAPSKENASELGDDPDEVNKIKLDKAETYYEFFVDTWNRTYTVRDYPVSQAINPVSHLRYGQDDLNTWWDHSVPDPWWQEFYFGPATGPGDVMRMEQDPKNPNIFYCYNMDYKAGDKTNFMLHNWHSHGWWNFAAWRADNSSDPSKFVYYGNFFPDATYCGHYESNMDYFQARYVEMDPNEYAYMYPNAGTFDINRWGDEGYRKNFIGDNWVKVQVGATGKYTFKVDLHAERGWMYLQ
ncbi:MAG: hypothetical protein NC082_00290 [Clostridiales bacterium]|nr:hypothetical protein [Clostridiales bacterium]